jgi:hypothetical protein
MNPSALTMETILRMKQKLKNRNKFKLGLKQVITIGKARTRASIHSRVPACWKNTHRGVGGQFPAWTSDIAAERHPLLLI